MQILLEQKKKKHKKTAIPALFPQTMCLFYSIVYFSPCGGVGLLITVFRAMTFFQT